MCVVPFLPPRTSLTFELAVALLPSHTGKGLLTASLHHLRESYLVPVLNVAYIESHAFVGNAGSRAVHLKCGFEQTGSTWIRERDDRGGQLRESWNFEWRRAPPSEAEDHVAITSPSLRALISSRSPLLFSPSHEPYLPFPPDSPFSSYFMTPFRLSDAPSFVHLVRDPTVDPWLFSPPKPFLLADAEKRIKGQMSSANKILASWVNGVEGWPCAVLRMRNEDGSDEFVGDLGVEREEDFLEVEDLEERQSKVEENGRRERGDPEIIWTMGCESVVLGLATSLIDSSSRPLPFPYRKGTDHSSPTPPPRFLPHPPPERRAHRIVRVRR